MKDYTAVVRRKPDADIQHWKYLKRERVNGKWRYTYDKTGEGNASVRDLVKDTAKEAGSDVQNVVYQELDSKYKKEQDEATTFSDFAESTVKRGANAVMRAMNNIGDGTLDDSVHRGMKNAKRWLAKFFG